LTVYNHTVNCATERRFSSRRSPHNSITLSCYAGRANVTAFGEDNRTADYVQASCYHDGWRRTAGLSTDI